MRPFVLLLLTLSLAAPALAEIYRWTDTSGQTHFTQDLSKVPARYRRQAEQGAGHSGSRSRFQSFDRGGDAAASAQPGSSQSASTQSSSGQATSHAGQKVWRIRVQRAGTAMTVMVRLNNEVSAPFIVDTGATDVVLPKSVAQQLGLSIGPGTRTKVYSTANGMIEQPVVMLRSVSLGGASVEDVPASVSDSMSIGLLGLSYFNHFTYNVDAARGVVTLERNRLASSGGIRGGRSEAQWRSEFRSLGYRRRTLEQDYQSTSTSKSRERRKLETELGELERHLDALEDEADAARVPMAWRD